jgi:hypothetical protein
VADIPTGPDAPRAQTLFASHRHYAVIDGPVQSGVFTPPYLGGGGGVAQMRPPMVDLGLAADVLNVVVGYHPTATEAEIIERLGVTPELFAEWRDEERETIPHMVMEPAGWWELLKMRAEAYPAYEQSRRERMARHD